MKIETAQLIEKNKTNSTWSTLYQRAIAMGKNEDSAATYAEEMEEHLADEAMDQAIMDSE